MHRLALVTGASSGLGKELCIQLAAKKIPLLITGKNKQALEETAHLLPTDVEICVSDLKNRKNLIAKIHERTPDLIINNAGVGYYGDVLTHNLETIEVNVEALTEISLESAKALASQNKKGTIMNISSAAAFFTYPSYVLYSASKAYVNSFSKSLDAELKKKGIRVLCVCPGQIDTPFHLKSGKKLRLAMPVEKAAKLILKQIEKQKPFNIIDWRYKILVFLSRGLTLKAI